MSKLIELHGKYGIDKYAIVDEDDYQKLKSFYWYIREDGTVFRVENKKKIFMAREILKINPEDYDQRVESDHINHNRLDNRKSNLRIVTIQQNQFNRRIQKNNKTGFKGVYKVGNKYYAKIKFCGENIFLGSFDKKEDAALSYNNKALELFGEYARPNNL